MSDMRRRELITLIGGAAAAWPLVGRAQQPMPVIGFLRSASLIDATHLVAAFGQGLKEAGFVEGQNVAIEYRSADEHLDRLPALVADLIRRPVAVIVGNTPAALAAKAATTTVPIVFVTGTDPVRDGLVASLNRPGGNVTGVSFLAGATGTKLLELLRQVAPNATTIAVLVNPNSPETIAQRREVQAAAQAIGQPVIRCRECPRHRGSLCNVRPTRSRRAAHRYWRVHELPSGAACRAGGPLSASRDF
jgi:putative ABC transport system substrate-binding protein